MRASALLIGTVLAAAVSVGCWGPRTTFVSNRGGETGLRSPSRLLFASHLLDERDGSNFGEPFAAGVEEGLAAGLRACRVEVRAYRITGAPADRALAGGAVDDFRADAVLLIRRGGGSGGYLVGLTRGEFDLALLDTTLTGSRLGAFLAGGGRPEPIWRAVLSVRQGDHSFGIKTFADDGLAVGQRLAERLHQDGFFPGCGAGTGAGPAKGSPAP